MREKLKLEGKVSVGEEELPFDVSPAYEGERIRKGDMFVEFGRKKPAFELVLAVDDVEDMKVTLVGKDIDEMEEGKAYPLAMIYYVSGIERDLESVLERRNHEFMNYIEGCMHLNSRYEVWIRISKGLAEKLKSLTQIAKAVMKLYKSSFPFIKGIEAIYITDEELVKKLLEEYAMPIYEERDKRIEKLRDEDVDEFYTCTLCQSFAPTHVCVISPERPALCGALTWFDARASAMVDPEGPNKPVKKGECIDPIGGEYEGVNEVVQRESGGTIQKVKLHSFLDSPHTSCGCFEVVGFYIPEVDGFGFVHRGYDGLAVNGLPFSTMAGQCGGGKQVVGFIGIGIGYFRSKKFFQADGGWERVVWMPKALKERIINYIPEEMRDKIATEEDATNIEELKAFMAKVGHPLMKRDVKMQVLRYIEEREEISAEDIMKEFGLSAEELKNVLNGLVDEGYLEREFADAILESLEERKEVKEREVEEVKVEKKEVKEAKVVEEEAKEVAEAKEVTVPLGGITIKITLKNAKIKIDRIVIKKS